MRLLQNKVDSFALHETHFEDIENNVRGNIPGYRIVEAIGHKIYGVATYCEKGHQRCYIHPQQLW